MLPYLWMLIACFFFTVMGALAHKAGEWCDWQTVAMSRCLLVVVFVGIYARLSGAPLVFWRPRVLWMRSIAGSLSLVASFYALTRMPISTVLTLTNMFPLWVALLSWPMLRVWPAPRVWFALVLGILGVWLIQQPQAGGPPLALFVAIFASLATSVAMLGLHRLHDLDPRAVVVHFAMVATIFCIAAFLVLPLDPGPLPFWHWKPLLFLTGIGITASVGQVFLTKAFTGGDPAKVSVVGLSQVVFAVIFDRLMGHEFDELSLVGMALILTPTAWIMRRQRGR